MYFILFFASYQETHFWRDPPLFSIYIYIYGRFAYYYWMNPLLSFTIFFFLLTSTINIRIHIEIRSCCYYTST